MYGQDVPGTDSSAGVVAEGLGKQFGDLWALRDVDLVVPAGSILGLLGHNGAGKTTAIRILTTLTQPTTGRARVAGLDVVTDAARVRTQIGLAGQSASVDGLLTARANLEMIGRLYHLPRAAARRRADELLERLDIAAAADRLVRTFSGGMRRRLDLAASLVAAPPVLFLDEPHHRPRPPRPKRPVGVPARARRGRGHTDADHPVPRGGRPARRRHRGARPRPGRGRRLARPAEGADRRIAHRRDRRGPVGPRGSRGSGRPLRRRQRRSTMRTRCASRFRFARERG